jgi:hypothetical protein
VSYETVAFVDGNAPPYSIPGDGSTDATAAFLDAVAEAVARVWPLKLGRGVYMLDPDCLDDLLATSGCKLYGDGHNCTVLKLRSAGNYFTGTLGTGCAVIGIHATGNTFNSRFLEVTGGGSAFLFERNRLEDFGNLAPLWIGEDTCTQSHWTTSTLLPGSPGGTVIQLVPTGSDAGSTPRHFSDLSLSGGVIEIGDVNDLFLSDQMLRNISFTGSSPLGAHFLGAKAGSLGGATTL